MRFYQLPLHKEHDRDICKRLDEIPRTRKAEWVRNALRYYMNIENQASHQVTQSFVPPTTQSNNRDSTSIESHVKNKESDVTTDDIRTQDQSTSGESKNNKEKGMNVRDKSIPKDIEF